MELCFRERENFCTSASGLEAERVANKRVSVASRLAWRLHMSAPQAIAANGTTGCAAIHLTSQLDGT